MNDLNFDQICTLVDAYCRARRAVEPYGIEGTLQAHLSCSLFDMQDSTIQVMINELNSIATMTGQNFFQTEESFDQHEKELDRIERAMDNARNIPMPGNAEAFNKEMQKRMDEVDNETDDVVSDCCGASPECNGDCDSTDIGICPCCHDHCEFIKTTD